MESKLTNISPKMLGEMKMIIDLVKQQRDRGRAKGLSLRMSVGWNVGDPVIRERRIVLVVRIGPIKGSLN